MTPRHTSLLLTGLLLMASTAAARESSGRTDDARRRVGIAYGKLPLSFEANRGQAARPVQFLARGRGYTLFLSATDAALSLSGPHSSPGEASIHRSVRMHLIGSNPAARVVGLDPIPGKSNYFIGRDPRSWHLDVPHYARVGYREAYPGIDVVFYGDDQGRLEHDFIVAPGADPSAIRFAFEGIDGLELDRRGDLVLRLSAGRPGKGRPSEPVVRLQKPRIYQEAGGRRREIPGKFVVENGRSRGHHSRQVRFDVGAYDRRLPLVIDPVLVYSTYLGGTGDLTYLPTGVDGGTSVAVDAAGNAYVVGHTDSADFPASDPLHPGLIGSTFVTKFNPEGSALVYSSFIGGAGEIITAIAVDGLGNAYLTGDTVSHDFPITAGAFQRALGGPRDAFVIKLNPEGNALVYSTYLGGTAHEGATGIAVDDVGNAFVAGHTFSSDFPVTPGAAQPSSAGYWDVFLAKLNAVGSALVHSTYLGGSSTDFALGVAIDGAGSAYVGGQTTSSDFPLTPGAFQPGYGGTQDGFVTKLNPEGTAYVYSTYLGGSSAENVVAVAVDALGHAYLTGGTTSFDFPVTPGAFQSALGGETDAFVTRLNPEGSAPVYSTYLGGSAFDIGYGIAVDSSGHAHVAGFAGSGDFPTANAIQAAPGGNGDAFVIKLVPAGTAAVYSTYLGGAGSDYARGIALGPTGDIYVTGGTGSLDLPVTPGSFQVAPAITTDVQSYTVSVEDAFVARIGAAASPGLALAPATAPFATQRLGSTSPPSEVRLLAAGSEPLAITSIEASGDFTQTNTCGSVVPPGAMCTFTVTFTPTAAGARSGAITIVDNAPGAPHVIPLAGEAIDPQISLVPASLTFGSQEIGSTSEALTVSLSNPGTSNLYVGSYLGSIQVTGDFSQTHTCDWVVAPGGTCTISVRFRPTLPGTRTGQVYIQDNAPGSPHVIPLIGTATGTVPVVEFSPTSLMYGYQPLGTTSPPQALTLRNIGTAPLTIFSMEMEGHFGQTNNCGTIVAAGAHCTVNLVFTPTFNGIQTGTLAITDNTPAGRHAVGLRGNDSNLWAGVSPASLTFAAQEVGTRSSAQAVIYTNRGWVPVAIASIVASGDFAQTNNCGTSLAVGTTCTIAVTFAPTATGARTGALTITDNASGAPRVVPLAGTGLGVNVPPTASLTFACNGLACSFNGSGSADGDGTIASYAWAFGDAATASGVGPNHTYAAGGSYTVTLSVTDNFGAMGSQSQVITVVNNPPVASFTFTCSGMTCAFDGLGSADSDGVIASHAWAFGDGTTASGAVVSHAYALPDTYTATLTVTDNEGATGTRSEAVAPNQSHVGDLDGTSTLHGGSWTAVVTITVHQGSHGVVANAGVSGSWTGGSAASCTTNGAGQCTVSRSAILNGTKAATFTVAGVTHPSLTYRAADNHDPDGDSSGRSITVSRR